MIKELITRISEKYGATLTFSTTNDNFWKYNKEVAKLTNFENVYNKLNCQHDIIDQLDKWGLDYKFLSGFNPDIVTLEWREV
jgi:hypothetical protein